jgi:hypothetical protein
VHAHHAFPPFLTVCPWCLCLHPAPSHSLRSDPP